MLVRFKELQLHNFASYQDTTIELHDMGYTLVSGRNNCKLDNAYSNGSGKSALFNGLCYALTGETTQGISSGFENIFADPDDCWVKLSMTVDNDEFVIKRIKTPKQNLLLWVNGEEISGKGIRESSKILATYLPDLNVDIVNGIILLGQGLPRRFTNNKPSHRKELLENLTKSDFMIQSIKDKLELRLDSLKTSLREKEDDLIKSNSQLKVYNEQLDNYNKDLALYEDFKNNNSLTDKINSLTETVKTIQDDINKNNDEIEKVNLVIKQLRVDRYSLNTKKEGDLIQSLSSINKELNKTNSEYIEVSSEIKSLKKEIQRKKSITDICPTCGQKIPEVVKPSTEDEELKLVDLVDSSDDLELKIKKLTNEKDQAVENNRTKYEQEMKEVEENISANEKLLSSLTSKSTNQERNKSKTELELYKLINLRDGYNKILTNIKNTKDSITTLETNINTLNVDVTKINDRLDIVSQMMTLAKREFRGILLSNIIEFIDKKVKQYSKEVFGTDQLSFTLNENHIDITYCDKLYENLSGGEKQKIDVIVQLALRSILSKQLNLHFNMLVLDEIYDGLDTISCQKITNLISNLTDIDSIFIISHHVQDLEITYDNNLLVEKSEEGLSTVTFD